MKLPGGYRIATPAAVILLVFFFLPWMTVSCAGQPLGSFSGMSLAISSSTQDIGGMPDLFLIPLAGIIILVFAYLAVKRARLETNLDVYGLVALGVLPILDLLIRFAATGRNAAQMGLDVHFEFGFFGIILGLIGVIGGAVYNWTLVSARQETMGNYPGAPQANEFIDFYPEGPPETAIYTRDRPAVAVPTDIPPTQIPEFNAQRAELHVLSGPAEGERFALHSDDALIGRSAACDIKIPDPSISRKHARLRYYQGQWFIQDQNSAAGLIVNGKKIPAGQINPGDIIQLGDTRLRFAIN